MIAMAIDNEVVKAKPEDNDWQIVDLKNDHAMIVH